MGPLPQDRRPGRIISYCFAADVGWGQACLQCFHLDKRIGECHGEVLAPCLAPKRAAVPATVIDAGGVLRRPLKGQWVVATSVRNEGRDMSSERQLRLGAFMRPASIHTGAWRYPGAFPDANFNFAHIKRFAQTLERAKFDAFFMADHMAVLNMPLQALKRSHTVTSFEPFTLLSALSQVTERIGLIATGSTTFDAPYHIARRFASLDHLSGGRAGWNIVTTSNPDAALNFGLDDHIEHDERYRRAREFYDVVTGLWELVGGRRLHS